MSQRARAFEVGTDVVVGLVVAGVFGGLLIQAASVPLPCHPVWHLVGLVPVVAAGLATVGQRKWARALMLAPLGLLGLVGVLIASMPAGGESTLWRLGLLLVSVVGPLAYAARVLVAQESWLHRWAAMAAGSAMLFVLFLPATTEPVGLGAHFVYGVAWLGTIVSAVLLARGRTAGVLAALVTVALLAALPADLRLRYAALLSLLPLLPIVPAMVRFVRRSDRLAP